MTISLNDDHAFLPMPSAPHPSVGWTFTLRSGGVSQGPWGAARIPPKTHLVTTLHRQRLTGRPPSKKKPAHWRHHRGLRRPVPLEVPRAA